MRDCDVCVFVQGFSDDKVANTTTVTFVEKHVCALDVTVNDMHFRVQVGHAPCNVREHKNPFLGRQQQQDTTASLEEEEEEEEKEKVRMDGRRLGRQEKGRRKL